MYYSLIIFVLSPALVGVLLLYDLYKFILSPDYILQICNRIALLLFPYNIVIA